MIRVLVTLAVSPALFVTLYKSGYVPGVLMSTAQATSTGTGRAVGGLDRHLQDSSFLLPHA
jgi:hypothetical protein